MIAALVLALATAAPSPAACSQASAAVRQAQHDWIEFKDADFVNFATEAEGRRKSAIAELARADAAAKHCPRDPTAKARAALHYELRVVDARRRAAAEGRFPSLPVPPPAASEPAAGCSQPDSAPYPLGSISPAATDGARLRLPHGTTIVTVLVGADGSVLGTLVTASSGDPVLDGAVAAAARLVTYAPARVRCRASPGEYRFSYTFPQL
jgi:TonB family protein